MASDRKRGLGSIGARAAFELLIVFVGVGAALWIDARLDDRARRERTVAIAEAMSTEIGQLNEWYEPWRDSVAVGFEAWQERVENGERPPPYYFRQPGSEFPPTIGWDVGMASGLLETFDPALVFEIGNMYTEWNGIGARIARYHASTESVVFPAVADPSTIWRVDGRQVSSPRYRASTGDSVVVSGLLLPEFAANLAVMHEILAEMDDKYGWALRVKTRLDSAVAEIRGSERGASY
jgi:hypothetical protein